MIGAFDNVMSEFVSYPCDCITGCLHIHTLSADAARHRGIHVSHPSLWLDASRTSAPDAAAGLFAVDEADAIEGALWGALIGDALGAPLHWFYSWPALRDARDAHFNGALRGYAATPGGMAHPNSAAYFSRCDPQREPVDIWGGAGAAAWAKAGTPYHGSLEIGDNTLTGRLLGGLIERCGSDGRFDATAWLRTYVQALTKKTGPSGHNDTWTDETHRVFFRNIAAGASPFEAGMEDSCLSSLVLAIPICLLYVHNSDAAALAVRTALQFTHKSDSGTAQAIMWGDLLATLIAPVTSARRVYSGDFCEVSEAVKKSGIVLAALEAACATFSDGRTDLAAVLASGADEETAFHGAPGAPPVFSSR